MANPLPNRSADAVLVLARTILSFFGKPKAVLTDNGEEFMSYAVQNFPQRLRIEHLHTSPYHPQTNGRLEKFNDTDPLLAHHAHTNPSTGASPAYMMYGRHLRLPGDSVFDSLRIPPTDTEIAKLQHARLEHIKNLEQYRQEANAKALARLEAEADKRDAEMDERGLGIGDLVQLMTRNGYILRHLYNGGRIRRYFPRADQRPAIEVPNAALWYASGDLQRRDAQHRLRSRRRA